MFDEKSVNFNTQTLYMCKGLPGCGKSTLARKLVDESKGKLKRVNRDTLRGLLDNYDYSKRFNPTNEKFIAKARDELISQALQAGYSVITDDTNLTEATFNHFKKVAEKAKVRFEVIDLTDTPLATCIKQDLRRLESVGKDVILKFWYNNICLPQAKLNDMSTMQGFVKDGWIFDIDGTLAHSDGIRGPFEEDKYDQDELDLAVASVFHALKETDAKILVVSGREGSQVGEAKTRDWLDKHSILYDELFMRAAGDHRGDDVVKREIYESKIKGRWNILGVFDDRQRVVQEWQKLGLKVFNVGLPYDFDLVR